MTKPVWTTESAKIESKRIAEEKLALLREVVTQHRPSTAPDELQAEGGYRDAFYEIARMLDIGTRPSSPREVWEHEMRPRLSAALARPDRMAEMDQTCILRKRAGRFSAMGDQTVICGQIVAEQYLRQGYTFDWQATDKARSRDAALSSGSEGGRNG